MTSRSFFSSLLIAFFILLISCSSENTVTPDVPPVNPDTEEPEEEATWQLVWEDEFDDDQLDESSWSYQFGTGEDEGLNRWGNNELQYYTDREENIYLEDGYLNITAQKENFEGMGYTSARIRTKDKGDWKFGRFEIRAKLPQGQGIWPAVWMLSTDEVFGIWPKSGEIDITEMVGHKPATVHGTVHYGPEWPNNQNKGESFSLQDGIFADDFHLFSIEWEVDKIQFFVDENLYFTVTPSTLTPHPYPFNNRFHLLINLAVGGNWPGNPDSTTEFPQTMSVDYVRVYQFK